MPGRKLPVFDPHHQPATWNERMFPGEVAVHASNSGSCDIFPSLAEATAFAQNHIVEDPTALLRLYSHEGFVGEPLLELHGSAFKGERDMSPRLRRWLGGGLLSIGILLLSVDWLNNFKFSWPSLIGSRLIIPGIVLVFTEWMIVLTARQKKRRAEHLNHFTSESL